MAHLGTSYKYCNGQVGAVVGDGEWFVTSPNMDFVPQPPLGGTHSMHICANYRYGEDNPLQWPQPYLASNCHLGAIPLCPGPDDHMSIMWWIPEPEDFQPTSAYPTAVNYNANVVAGEGCQPTRHHRV